MTGSILVVSTYVDELANVAQILRHAGYRVVTATSFAAADRFIRSDSVGLLIADIRLGSFNGLHLALHCSSHHPKIPAIVTNAYADQVLEAEATRLNAPYLVHPIDADVLLSHVAR